MAKNKSLKKNNEFHEMDIPDEIFYPEESMEDVMLSLIDAGKHQQSMAIELTKLVVGQHSSANLSEENIFSIFKRASKVVTESFPLKHLSEHFSE